jgi:hypothetical protein
MEKQCGGNMSERKAWCFFYGYYINILLLKEINIIPQQYEVAKLNGFDIRIEPWANLIPSNQHCVYGMAAMMAHDEIGRLYDHARVKFDEVYLPEAVLIETWQGNFRPSLCYIAPHMQPRPAEREYIDRIVNSARDFRFPDWYLQKLESFRS